MSADGPTSEVAPGPPPPEPERNGPSGLVIGITAGALVAVIVAIVVALSAGGDTSTTTAASNDPATAVEDPTEAPASEGDAAPTAEEGVTEPDPTTEDNGADSETFPVSAEIIGTALVPPPEAGDDPSVGTPAPGMVAPDLAGRTTTVDVGDGRAKVIGFFAHWCPHCQRELPRLTTWLAENDVPKGVDIYAVSTAVDEGAPNWPPDDWFEREGWPEPVLVDTDANVLAAGYGLTGFPFFVVIGGDGNVVVRSSGELETAQWEALLDLAASSVDG